ncbi:MAG: hypothetical protein ACM3O3_12840 [Syntrophothermus sp.]
MSREIVIAKVLELCNSNEIYMSLDVLLMTSVRNLNTKIFTHDFINDVVANKDFYIGLPLVVERDKLEKGQINSLGHALNKRTGELKTHMIGSYVDFYEKYDEQGNVELHGTVRVFKRFPKVCEAIQELYDEDILRFSVEVIVGQYSGKDGKEIDVHTDNKLIGDCIVSFPAEVKSKAELLVAEALNKDLTGGEQMNRDKHTDATFFKGANIRLENCELDIGQIQRKVYAKCRETIGEDFYRYDCTDFGASFMIVQDYYSGDLFRVDYTVNNNDVTVSDLYQVTKNYLPLTNTETSKKNEDNPDDEMPMDDEMPDEEMPDDEMPDKNNMKKKMKKDMKKKNEQSSNGEDSNQMTLEELKAKLEASENENKSLKDSIVEKDTLIAEKDTTINELNEKVNTLSETVITKDTEIAELTESKKELDSIKLEKAEAEKVQKKVELKEKYSKLLSEETLALPEISEAIETLNETVLRDKVVESALEKAETNKNKTTKDTVTASITDDINVGSSDVLSKYITIGK